MLRSLEVPDEPSLARVLEAELASRFPPGSRIIPWRRGADFFALRVVPPGAATERVLRVPLPEVATSVYDGTVDFGDVVEREAFAHRLLERHGVPVAPLLGWGRARRRSVGDASGLLGVAMCPMWRGEGGWALLSD